MSMRIYFTKLVVSEGQVCKTRRFVNAEYVEGPAHIASRFDIILDVGRVISIEQMAAIGSVDATQ